MKNSELNRKNAGATGIAYKACVWILSIMLVVTGMAPSFAVNNAASEAGSDKAQTAVLNGFSSFYKNIKSSSKALKKNFAKESLRNKTAELIKNKRSQTFNLNRNSNVYAEFDGNENLTVSAKNTSGDMNIEKDMWWAMAKKLGAGESTWKDAEVRNIRFNTNGISLPEDSSCFFNVIKGKINGCEKLNTSKVKRMNSMFDRATSANPDVSKWNVSNVTNMGAMFYGATSANPDVSKWNVSNVTNMGAMFYEATSANPDVSKWNVSNVTNMRWMFIISSSANPDVSKWDTSKVTDMSGMFSGLTSANPDVSKWNVSNVTDMSWMFSITASANPDVSKWDTSKVTNMSGMFYEATSANPDVSNWNVSNVTDMNRMFNSTGVIKVDLSRWVLNEELSKNYDRESNMFIGCSKLEYLKTPAGLKTSISEVNKGFKIVKLKKGFAASVEKEDQNFNSEYIINNDGDKKAMYHIYAKDVYAGVIFDKNSGDTEGCVNHEIVKKGESINESDGSLPAEKPTLAGDEFLGWTTKKDINTSMFDEKTNVNKDTTAYALWKNKQKINVTFDNGGGSGNMDTVHVDKGSNYQLPPCTFTAPDGKEFDKWSVKVGDNPAEDKKPGDNITVSDDITVKAIWKAKTPPAPVKAKVTLDGNGGVLAGGYEATLNVDEGSTIKAQLEAAVMNNMFTKPGYKLIGFSKSKFALAADYNVDAPVYGNFTLYAVYEEAPELTTVTIKYSDIDLGEDAKIEDVSVGKPIGAKLDGNARDRDGYRFLGYSKVQNAAKPDFFKKSIVTENLVIYPVYKEATNEDKVKVAFKLNDGTDASLKTEEVTRYESLGNKIPTKDKVAERDGYLFTGWAKSKSAKYPDFFRSTVVKGDMTVYAVWKSLYNEKLGQAVLKVSAKAKGYELTITPPAANLHTGFEIFRSEKKDFKPSKDNKIATVDRNILKYLDEKADNSKAYYYAVRAIDADGSYNGTKVTYIGKLSDKVLAAPLPKDKGVTATVAGKGAVSLEFNKTIAAAKYKVTVTAPYDKKFKTIERFVEAGKLAAAGRNKVKANVTGLPMGKFLAFKLEALEADNTKLVEYGNSFAFMMGAVEKLTAKVNKKSRVLNVKFKAMKGVNGYEAKIVIGGKVKTVKLKKGKKKLRGFIVGSIKLPKKKGNYTFTIRAFKKIGKLKYYGQTITKVVK